MRKPSAPKAKADEEKVPEPFDVSVSSVLYLSPIVRLGIENCH